MRTSLALTSALLLALGAAALTPRQLAGQRVVYSYVGQTVPAELLTRLRAGEAGGVIFFKGNIASPQQLATVSRQLKAAFAQSGLNGTLLLMTDQEGGIVKRLPGEPSMSAKQVGQQADYVGAATKTGTGAAQTLLGAGLNVNLAPVLDVARKNSFIDQQGRSYSMSTNVVSKCGAAFVTASQKLGVATTIKHFPGLGSAPTGENTDLRPVTLKETAANLRSIDIAAYPASIAAGSHFVMMSWAKYTNLDAANPAGMSRTIIQDELRKKLGFKGVVISDAINAKALSGSTAERALAAAHAGMDMILSCAGTMAEGNDAVTALANAYTSGSLDKAEFEASVARITKVRLAVK